MEAIYSICESKTDIVVIVATGGGKTVVYIMVALITKKTVVVFEPLVSVIQDQKRAIDAFNIGIKARNQ